MSPQIGRRTFIAQTAGLASTHVLRARGWAGEKSDHDVGLDSTCRLSRLPHDATQQSIAADRELGLLVGGMLGDAIGGPVEFLDRARKDNVLPATRNWPADRVLDKDERQRLARSLPMLSYETLRPDSAPYGPWPEKAAAGTVTDDTRHKIVLMRTVQAAVECAQWPITAKSVARQYIQFQPKRSQPAEGREAELCEEGMRQYRFAAQWLLGNRDLRQARPVERLWSGIDNCSGQMLLPPLAAVFPAQPEAAYRAAYAIDFVDTPAARDIASALIAGIASVLGPDSDQLTTTERWQLLLSTIRATDPFGLAEVPFAGRPLHRWLDLADSLAQRADGRPARLFELLEREGKPVYWWDAHFTLLCPLAMLKFCEFDVLAALHLTLDFGHDTDSYAQVIGCLGGAVCGISTFPSSMCKRVLKQVEYEYGESVNVWQQLLAAARQRHADGDAVFS